MPDGEDAPQARESPPQDAYRSGDQTDGPAGTAGLREGHRRCRARAELGDGRLGLLVVWGRGACLPPRGLAPRLADDVTPGDVPAHHRGGVAEELLDGAVELLSLRRGALVGEHGQDDEHGEPAAGTSAVESAGDSLQESGEIRKEKHSSPFLSSTPGRCAGRVVVILAHGCVSRQAVSWHNDAPGTGGCKARAVADQGADGAGRTSRASSHG